MRVLVTGASGFIGSELVPLLRQRGHTVIEAARAAAGRFNFFDPDRRGIFDLRDSQETREAVLAAKPDVIIHLAAQSAVAYSFTHPQEVNEVNYMGTVRLANAAREAGAWFIMAGTSEIYGRADSRFPLTEEQPMGGTSPYAASKIAAIEYLRVLEKTYQLPLTIMAPFNTVGRALVNNRHFVVERAITQAIEEQHIDLHDPNPYRDFCFRSDHADAYLAVLDHREQAVGQLFNICTGRAVSIGEMAGLVAHYVGQRLNRAVQVSFGSVPDRPLDITRLQGSNEKAKRLLGWTPRYTIEQALEKAADEWVERLGVGGKVAP